MHLSPDKDAKSNANGTLNVADIDIEEHDQSSVTGDTMTTSVEQPRDDYGRESRAICGNKNFNTQLSQDGDKHENSEARTMPTISKPNTPVVVGLFTHSPFTTSADPLPQRADGAPFGCSGESVSMHTEDIEGQISQAGVHQNFPAQDEGPSRLPAATSDDTSLPDEHAYLKYSFVRSRQTEAAEEPSEGLDLQYLMEPPEPKDQCMAGARQRETSDSMNASDVDVVENGTQHGQGPAFHDQAPRRSMILETPSSPLTELSSDSDDGNGDGTKADVTKFEMNGDSGEESHRKRSATIDVTHAHRKERPVTLGQVESDDGDDPVQGRSRVPKSFTRARKAKKLPRRRSRSPLHSHGKEEALALFGESLTMFSLCGYEGGSPIAVATLQCLPEDDGRASFTFHIDDEMKLRLAETRNAMTRDEAKVQGLRSTPASTRKSKAESAKRRDTKKTIKARANLKASDTEDTTERSFGTTQTTSSGRVVRKTSATARSSRIKRESDEDDFEEEAITPETRQAKPSGKSPKKRALHANLENLIHESASSKHAPKYCHQCRSRSPYAKMHCNALTSSGVPCNNSYCHRCVRLRYPDAEFKANAPFTCFKCSNTCNCDVCCRKRGEEYTKSMDLKTPKLANAAGSNSVAATGNTAPNAALMRRGDGANRQRVTFIGDQPPVARDAIHEPIENVQTPSITTSSGRTVKPTGKFRQRDSDTESEVVPVSKRRKRRKMTSSLAHDSESPNVSQGMAEEPKTRNTNTPIITLGSPLSECTPSQDDQHDDVRD